MIIIIPRRNYSMTRHQCQVQMIMKITYIIVVSCLQLAAVSPTIIFLLLANASISSSRRDTVINAIRQHHFKGTQQQIHQQLSLFLLRKEINPLSVNEEKVSLPQVHRNYLQLIPRGGSTTENYHTTTTNDNISTSDRIYNEFQTEIQQIMNQNRYDIQQLMDQITNDIQQATMVSRRDSAPVTSIDDNDDSVDIANSVTSSQPTTESSSLSSTATVSPIVNDENETAIENVFDINNNNVDDSIIDETNVEIDNNTILSSTLMDETNDEIAFVDAKTIIKDDVVKIIPNEYIKENIQVDDDDDVDNATLNDDPVKMKSIDDTDISTDPPSAEISTNSITMDDNQDYLDLDMNTDDTSQSTKFSFVPTNTNEINELEDEDPPMIFVKKQSKKKKKMTKRKKLKDKKTKVKSTFDIKQKKEMELPSTAASNEDIQSITLEDDNANFENVVIEQQQDDTTTITNDLKETNKDNEQDEEDVDVEESDNSNDVEVLPSTKEVLYQSIQRFVISISTTIVMCIVYMALKRLVSLLLSTMIVGIRKDTKPIKSLPLL